MALLLKDREANHDAAGRPPGGDPRVVVPGFACETCGAAMAAGQDWCLECGAAARGRLGARPGWRSALTVVGLTLLLVCGAVLASYAALTSDAERTASAPGAGNGAPIVAQTPAVPGPTSTTIVPGATGPGTTPPAAVTPAAAGPAAGLPGQTTAGRPIIPTTRPAAPATNRQIAPPASPSTSAGTTAPSSGATAPATRPQPQSQAKQPTAPASVAPQVIDVKADGAGTYDPAKRTGAEFGPAANAVDGKPATVWDVTVPADGKPIGAGLLVDLGRPYALQSLRIATPTPGFRVELYGAVAKDVPEDVLDKRWQHLTDVKSVADDAPVSLKGKGDADRYRLLLVYVTAAAEPADPRAAIGELTLRGTP